MRLSRPCAGASPSRAATRCSRERRSGPQVAVVWRRRARRRPAPTSARCPRSSSATRTIRAPTTPAARPTPRSGATATPSRTSTRPSRSTRTTRPAYTNRGLAYRQTNRNDAASRRFLPRHRGRSELRPGLYRPRQPPARPRQFPGGAERPVPGHPPDARIRRGPARARARLPEQGQHQKAVFDFDAAIDRNPFVAAPYAARGQSLVAAQPIRQGDRGSQRRAQRQQPRRRVLGLARRRL